MVRRKKLALKYTLTWVGASICLVILAVFDGIIRPFTRFLHIVEPTNALFMIVIFFILMILFTMTVTISKNDDAIRNLTQELALLQKSSDDKADRNKSEGK
jgi:hypothetical protein